MPGGTFCIPMTLMFQPLTGGEAERSDHNVPIVFCLPILKQTDWFHHAIQLVLKLEDIIFGSVGGASTG